MKSITAILNGDGIADALAYSKDSKWNISASTGAGYTAHFPVPLQAQGKNTSAPLVADLNGDGKSDIVQFRYIWNDIILDRVEMDVYITKNFLGNTYSYTKTTYTHPGLKSISLSKYSLGDVNGDGKTDLIFKQSIFDDAIVFSFSKNEEYNLVKNITDGMGFSTDFEYSYLSSPALSAYTDAQRGLVRWPLVMAISQSNGISGLKDRTSYKYGNVWVNYFTKRFLGFSNITINKPDDKRTEYTFLKNDELDQIVIKDIIHYKNNVAFMVQENSPEWKFVDDMHVPFNSLSVTHYPMENRSVHTKTILARDGRTQSVTEEIRENKDGEVYSSQETKYRYSPVAIPGNFQLIKLNTATTVSRIKGSSHAITKTLNYTYDNLGRISVVNDNSGTDGSIATFFENYTVYGLPASEKISDGTNMRTTKFEYDPTGRFITKKINPLAHTSSFEYNPATGNLLLEKDINGLETRYRYDDFGNQIATIRPDGSRDSLAVKWGNGNYTASKIPNTVYFNITYRSGESPATTYYDLLGRELCKEEHGHFTDTRYNNLGQLIKVSLPYYGITTSDANKKWTNITYDSYGRKKTEYSDHVNLVFTYEPRKVSVRDNLRGTSVVKEYDPAGNLIAATDPGGTIRYGYSYLFINQMLRLGTSFTVEGKTTTVLSDSRGNRVLINDPDAGSVVSVYNRFGELVSTTDANGNQTTYTYDIAGRVTEKKLAGNGGTQTITYEYDRSSSNNKGIGQLSLVRMDGKAEKSYYYDRFGRLSLTTKYIDNLIYQESFTYDQNGKLYRISYPDNFIVYYNFDQYGRLKEIRKEGSNELIYKVDSRNHLGQIIKCSYGNTVASQYTYNDFGLLKQIKTGDKKMPSQEKPDLVMASSIILPPPEDLHYEVTNAYQQMDYEYDSRGLMTLRKNAKNNQYEVFSYDNLDRLTGYRINNGITKKYKYDRTGNILTHPEIGDYIYENEDNKPHAVSQINLLSNTAISPSECRVNYNFSNQPVSITEGEYTLELFYNALQQRQKTILKRAGETVKTKFFISKFYEKEVMASGTRHLNYIYGENGIVAVFEQVNTNGQFYYIHTDHLGSYNLVTDQNKNRVQQSHFDPWGNRRQYNNWPLFESNTSLLFDRGFTGHEHLDCFKIINMNGRLYDPVIGRFFSPDPYVQLSGFTQNFNRYSYCLNNPLAYTDPDGEWIHIVAGGLIGGVSNLINNWNTTSGWGKFAAFGIGAASGALTAVNPALGATVGSGFQKAANNMLYQVENGGGIKNVDWSSVGQDAFLGAYEGGLTYLATFGLSRNGVGTRVMDKFNIKDATVRNIFGSAVEGTIAGAISGTASGISTGMMTGEWNIGQSTWKGAVFGGVAGMINAGISEIGYQYQLNKGKSNVINAGNTEAVAGVTGDAVYSLKNNTSGSFPNGVLNAEVTIHHYRASNTTTVSVFNVSPSSPWLPPSPYIYNGPLNLDILKLYAK